VKYPYKNTHEPSSRRNGNSGEACWGAAGKFHHYPNPNRNPNPWLRLGGDILRECRQDFVIGTTSELTSVLLIRWIHGCCSDTVVFPKCMWCVNWTDCSTRTAEKTCLLEADDRHTMLYWLQQLQLRRKQFHHLSYHYTPTQVSLTMTTIIKTALQILNYILILYDVMKVFLR